VPPTLPMARARAEVVDFVREPRSRFPDHGIEHEVFVTAPGSEIAEEHPMVAAIDAAHTEVFGAAPARDATRWFSDGSALTRYGIETVNYGTSSGLPGADGENLAIAGLVDTARVYALAATDLCEVDG
jgi:succinyl-diaminopimelate desuccinylase